MSTDTVSADTSVGGGNDDCDYDDDDCYDRRCDRNTRRKSWMTSRKFEEQLESDKIHADVLKECIVEESQDEEHHKFHFQEVLERVLQYTPLQVILLVLAIIDVAVVVSEILVTLHIYDLGKRDADEALEDLMDYLTKQLNIQNAIYLKDLIKLLNSTLHSCDTNGSSSSSTHSSSMDADQEEELQKRFVHLAGDPTSYLARWERKLLRSKRQADDISISANGLPENDVIEQLHVVEDALNITSIVILGIFVIVAVLKMVADGKHFLKQFMEIIDAFVVTLSFILDIIKYTGVLNKDATEAAIVLLLLWQIVRMFNGIMLSELKRLEFRIKLLKRTRKRVESKASILTNKLKLMEREVDGLRKLSRQRGALEDEIMACRPPLMTGKPSALAGLSCIASMSVGLSISTPIAVDLMEQRQCLIQSLTGFGRGSFSNNNRHHHGESSKGLSLVAMFPGNDSSSFRSNNNNNNSNSKIINNSSSTHVEAEESTAVVESASPKKVHFVSRRSGDDDAAGAVVFDDDDDDDDGVVVEVLEASGDGDGNAGGGGSSGDGKDGTILFHVDGRRGSRESKSRDVEGNVDDNNDDDEKANSNNNDDDDNNNNNVNSSNNNNDDCDDDDVSDSDVLIFDPHDKIAASSSSSSSRT